MFAAGDLVEARGDRWVVEEVVQHQSCALVRLGGTGGVDQPRTCRLLHPFDRLNRIDRVPVLRRVGKERWLALFKDALARSCAPGDLQAACHARLEVLPYQLEPALAALNGLASRFLLADEVGLGKTVQAGLLLAELQHCGRVARTLVLAPAGLRQQWIDELEQRFDLSPALIDNRYLRTVERDYPIGVNPWTVDRPIISSIDFIKQPEVLAGVREITWDLLIVDEAHHAVPGSARHAVVQSLASRARVVVLLTATPHAGDDAAFEALCSVGRLGDPIALFRRTRAEIGRAGTRRVHLLPVRLSREAMAMHEALGKYAGALWRSSRAPAEARLVAMVLTKRAFSTPVALLRSLQRRLSGLSEPASAEAQALLPFDADPSDTDVLPVVPCFDRVADERQALGSLIDTARAASADDRKIHALRRFLRRSTEPAIIFTEYRDTLDIVAEALEPLGRAMALLHGGLDLESRAASVRSFSEGRVDLLLATDAGSEGLNLHDRCRVIVNLELPWNPIRLEQRIGRVDRIGQKKTVHAVHLFAADTAESTVLARMQRRLERIRASEIDIAACIINREDVSPPASEYRSSPERISRIDLREEATRQALRIHAARRSVLARRSDQRPIIPVAVLDTHTLETLGASSVWLLRLRLINGNGRLVEDRLLPVAVNDHARYQEVAAAAEAYASRRIADLSRLTETTTGALRLREQHLRSFAVDGETLFQAGLFDNRALRKISRIERLRESCEIESDHFLARLEQERIISPVSTPALSLLLVAC